MSARLRITDIRDLGYVLNILLRFLSCSKELELKPHEDQHLAPLTQPGWSHVAGIFELCYEKSWEGLGAYQEFLGNEVINCKL